MQDTQKIFSRTKISRSCQETTNTNLFPETPEKKKVRNSKIFEWNSGMNA